MIETKEKVEVLIAQKELMLQALEIIAKRDKEKGMGDFAQYIVDMVKGK
jgi:phosphopantetheine adenylyltransferase